MLDPMQSSETITSSMLRDMIDELEQTKQKLILNVKDLKEQLAQQKEVSIHTHIHIYIHT